MVLEKTFGFPEIWKKNSNSVKKVFILEKELSNVILDPFLETDTDRNNNYYQPKTNQQDFNFSSKKKEISENPINEPRKVEERLQNDK